MKDDSNRCWCGDWHRLSFVALGRKHLSMYLCKRNNKRAGLA